MHVRQDDFVPESLTDDLSIALDSCRRVVGSVQAEQWALPTPCAGWSVEDLTAHLVLGNRMFAAILRGGPAPSFSSGDRADVGHLVGDRVSAYDEAAGELLAAFGAEGALERVVTVPFGTVPGSVALHLRVTELLVHGWDLARATGQTIDVPEALAQQELAFSERAVRQLPADRSPFGPPQPVGTGAPSLEHLVGLLGREV